MHKLKISMVALITSFVFLLSSISPMVALAASSTVRAPIVQKNVLLCVFTSTGVKLKQYPANAIPNNISYLPPFLQYKDKDLDGFGDKNDLGATACTLSAGYVKNRTDCNDNNAAMNPGYVELCGDNIDNNCSGVVNEGCVAAAVCPCWTASQIVSEHQSILSPTSRTYSAAPGLRLLYTRGSTLLSPFADVTHSVDLNKGNCQHISSDSTNVVLPVTPEQGAQCFTDVDNAEGILNY